MAGGGRGLERWTIYIYIYIFILIFFTCMYTHTNVGIERDIYAYIYMYTQIVCLMFYIFQVSLLDMQIISLFVIRLVCFAPVS